MGDWKGIRLGAGNKLQLYNLKSDLGETQDVAAAHPEMIAQMERIMERPVKPSDRYPVGELYQGDPIWKPTWKTH